ncbi:MAG: hypothetical protein NC926_02950 [Candidatus Omnitrophica bacterium]|nr:hypothetical protein [Candidatus Omnitrophota bacterium]
MNNLKQIGLATLMYVQDHEYMYFEYDVGGLGPYYRMLIPYLTKKYAEDFGKIVRCPSASKRDSWEGTDRCSIGVNFDATNGQPPGYKIKYASFKKPSLTILCADAHYLYFSYYTVYGNDGIPGNEPGIDTPDKPDISPTKYLSATRHSNGANYLYLDGHVNWRKWPFPYNYWEWIGR